MRFWSRILEAGALFLRKFSENRETHFLPWTILRRTIFLVIVGSSIFFGKKGGGHRGATSRLPLHFCPASHLPVPILPSLPPPTTIFDLFGVFDLPPASRCFDDGHSHIPDVFSFTSRIPHLFFSNIPPPRDHFNTASHIPIRSQPPTSQTDFTSPPASLSHF